MTLKGKLLKTYWRLEKRLVPNLRYSQSHYEEHLFRWIRDGAGWLDVGCGRRLLPPWRLDAERVLVSRARMLVGIDLDFASLLDNRSAHARLFGVVHDLPFRGEAFDVVTANMVVEHLADPEGDFREVARVLKPGGVFIMHTPNAGAFPTLAARVVPEVAKRPLVRLLDGRRSKDVFPTYYRCNSSSDVHRCAAAAGLHVAELSMVSTTALFSVIPPLAFLELLWIRFVQAEHRRDLRSNIITVLQKP
ncbi:MAG TPA: class I SAM-dependent methyltransferase [Gemmatimonadaceae bacterium]